MASRFLTVVCLLACSGTGMAGISAHAYNPFVKTYAPLVTAPVPFAAAASAVKIEEVDPHPQYQFAYNIHDSLTGDIKNQIETRDGGNVAGAYSVIDADGYKRTVSYTADDFNGFNAVVQREPVVATRAVVAQAAAVAAPAAVVRSAPVVQLSPIANAAPVVKTYAAAPLLQAAPVFKTSSAPLIQTTPVSRAFAARPVVHATPIVRSFTAAPAVHSAPVIQAAPATLVQPLPVFKSYATAPVVQSAPFVSTSYLSSVRAQQPHLFSLQQQLAYFNSKPTAAAAEQIPTQELLNTKAEATAQQETQESEAPQQIENEPTPIEYPVQQQVLEQHNEQEQKQEDNQQQTQQEEVMQQQHVEQDQLQLEFEQQQQVIQEQQKLFLEQQQQFAEQQQQVIMQQQQLIEQQQQQYFQEQQQLSPYPQQEIPQNPLNHSGQENTNDSDVVNARSGALATQQEESQSHATTAAPAPIHEDLKDSEDKTVKKSA